MKRWIAGFLIGIVLILVSVFVFIPETIRLNAGISVKATRPGLYRMLSDKANLAKWWPGKISNDSFYVDDFTYKINKGNITLIPISIDGSNTGLTTSLFLISIGADSTLLQWVGSIPASNDPVKRYISFSKAKKINNGMTVILQKMKSFYSKPENIYGFEIKQAFVTDSFLIATSGSCTGYPSNQFIYSLVDKLRNYAILHSARESGYPMLNVGTTNNITFDVKVALPIDKLLSSSGDILQKRMLGRGRILVTEVKGGIGTTIRAYGQLKQYAADHDRLSPAIPFYSLITDRIKEPDSSKWVTKIYFPVL